MNESGTGPLRHAILHKRKENVKKLHLLVFCLSRKQQTSVFTIYSLKIKILPLRMTNTSYCSIFKKINFPMKGI